MEVDFYVQNDQDATRGVLVNFIRVNLKEVKASDDWKAHAKDQFRLVEEILAAVEEHMDQPSE